MNIGKTYCGKTMVQSIMIIEENIWLTFSLGPQSYQTECCILDMFYQMQLISVIYCLTLYHSLLDQPLAAALSLNVNCDVYICNSLFKSHWCYVKLNQNWTGSPF